MLDAALRLIDVHFSRSGSEPGATADLKRAAGDSGWTETGRTEGSDLTTGRWKGIDCGGGPFVTELVIDHDDPMNPVSAGCLVVATLWRASTSGAGRAGGTVVVRVDVAYAQRPRHDRA